MAQFDVHRSRGVNVRAVPFLLVVQSSRFEQTTRRVVVPLVPSHLQPRLDPDLNPEFEVERQRLTMHTLQLASVPVSALGPVAASLETEGDRIIAAIDTLISRARG